MYEGVIMKVIPIIVLLLVTFAYAGNVYVCEYEYQADLCVYLVEYEYQADLCVYVVDYEYQTDDEDALWHFVDYEYQSDI